jgi:hypothetical protein
MMQTATGGGGTIQVAEATVPLIHTETGDLLVFTA